MGIEEKIPTKAGQGPMNSSTYKNSDHNGKIYQWKMDWSYGKTKFSFLKAVVEIFSRFYTMDTKE